MQLIGDPGESSQVPHDRLLESLVDHVMQVIRWTCSSLQYASYETRNSRELMLRTVAMQGGFEDLRTCLLTLICYIMLHQRKRVRKGRLCQGIA